MQICREVGSVLWVDKFLDSATVQNDAYERTKMPVLSDPESIVDSIFESQSRIAADFIVKGSLSAFLRNKSTAKIDGG